MSSPIGDRRGGSEKGFQASLSGASLPDLVQMECLAGTEAVFRVTSAHEVGYLFFRGGQVIHALRGDADGQRAAVEILAWNQGTFEPCNLALPAQASIQLRWQSLLLLAAQAEDEAGRRKLVRLPTGSPPVSGNRKSTPPEKPERRESLPAGYQALVRLDTAGNPLDGHGEGVEAFSASVAYAARMGQLIGEALGLDQLQAFECAFTDCRYLAQLDRAGAIVGVKAEPEADLASLRERAGL
jgi:hypothetical protein